MGAANETLLLDCPSCLGDFRANKAVYLASFGNFATFLKNLDEWEKRAKDGKLKTDMNAMAAAYKQEESTTSSISPSCDFPAFVMEGLLLPAATR